MALQLIQPKLTITEKAGWCLQFARRSFGAPAVEASAWQAWQNTQFKHEDRNFPDEVAIPVWFDWWGDVGYGRQRYGHVAVRTADGKVWSSPLSGTGRAWFASVDDLVRAFGGGMKYIGWSEDISGVRVMEMEDEMRKPSYEEVLSYFRTFVGQDCTEQQQNYYVARGLDILLSDLLQFNYDRKLELAAKLNSVATTDKVTEEERKEIERLTTVAEDAVKKIGELAK